jgi:hypothetical protein
MSDGPRPAVTLDCRVADILRIPQAKVTVLPLELDSISLFLKCPLNNSPLPFRTFADVDGPAAPAPAISYILPLYFGIQSDKPV